MCDGLFDKACDGQIGVRARKEKEIELEFNSFSQGRSSNLVSALCCRARFVDCVIMTLKAKQDHFVVDAKPLFESLPNLDDCLLWLRLAQPH
jgi:hypothetical protein